ncbi:uncharacterized protein LOC114716728 [Neltuma alba]|nr:uncharacterized protein LOC114716728 [Prosopis alba]
MGSLTEDQLLQMVRDFIESDSEAAFTSEALSEIHKPVCITSQLQEILWEVTDIEVEILEKIPKYAKDEECDGASHLKKLVVIKLRMDGYEASLCQTSWLPTINRPKGDYEFIDVMMVMGNTIEGKAARLIVDMDFRSQFLLAKPTRAYEDLTDMPPSIFVGTEERWSNITSLLCSAAKKSLREKGLHVPPWRKAAYMKSKWLSKDCKKISFTPDLKLGMEGELKSEN